MVNGQGQYTVANTQTPYSEEAEAAAIGAVLVNPDAFLSLASFLKPEDFFILRHQYIWEAMTRVSDRNEPIDILTLQEELRAQQRLAEIDGVPYLTQLIVTTPTSINAEVYGRLIERAALRRRLIRAADEIKELAHNTTMPTEQVTAEAESQLFSVTEQNRRGDVKTMRQAVSEYFEQVEYLVQHPETPLGLPTGFRDLDALLGGLQRSDLLIFAGRPGMGKTSFALSVAYNAAKRGARIMIFTMEMGADQIVQRLISMETGINTQNLRLGRITQQEYRKFVEATGRLSRLNIFIDDTPAMTPVQMRTKCRRLVHEHGLDLVIIDYIQLINGGDTFQNNRVQELSYISRAIKEMAREMNVPVLAAAQLSRAVEQRQDKHPQLSDLRESGSQEQDADVVMFLYREGVYNPAAENPNMAEIIIAKHRNGPTGSVQMHFERSLTRFMDAATETIDLNSL